MHPLLVIPTVQLFRSTVTQVEQFYRAIAFECFTRAGLTQAPHFWLGLFYATH